MELTINSLTFGIKMFDLFFLCHRWRALYCTFIVFALFISSVKSELSIQNENKYENEDEMMYLNHIPNYDLDKSYNFYFYKSETQNNTNLLLRIIEFCIHNEMDPVTYQNIFDQVHTIAKKDDENSSVESFAKLDTKVKDTALELLHQKYIYSFTNNTTKSISGPKYWKYFCGISQASEHYSTISDDGHIKTLRELFPMIITSLNRQFQENRYQVADPSFALEISIVDYWSNLLDDAVSRKVQNIESHENVIHNWVDEYLCIRVMLNRTFDDTLQPEEDISKRVQTRACRGSLESYTYSPLSYFFSLRLQANYKLRYMGDKAIQDSDISAVGARTISSFDSNDGEESVQHSTSDSIGNGDSDTDNGEIESESHKNDCSSVSIKKKPLIVISAYEYYIVEYLTHLFDAFELTWSFIAFIKKLKIDNYDLFNSYQYGLLIPFHNDLFSIRSSGLQQFVHLMFSTILRVAHDLDLHIYVKNVTHLTEFLLKYDQNNNITKSQLSILYSYNQVIFPVLMERAVFNALTHDGVNAMTTEMLQQCKQISVLQGNNNEYDNGDNVSQESCMNNDTSNEESERCRKYSTKTISTNTTHNITTSTSNSTYMPYRIVLAGRRGNRFISNMREVIATLEAVFQQSVDVIYFGDLTPCEQIAIAQSTSLFVFVHGAEGRMMSFMQPNTLAIELWPGCRTSDDFYMLYKFFYPSIADAARVRHSYFSATYASTTVCQAWEYRMRIAHGCGLTVVTDLFRKFLKKLYIIEQSKILP